MNENEEIKSFESENDEEDVVEDNSYYTYENFIPSPVVSAREGEELDEQEIEELIDFYTSYSSDFLVYFYGLAFSIIC